jgi:hypothetical protein
MRYYDGSIYHNFTVQLNVARGLAFPILRNARGLQAVNRTSLSYGRYITRDVIIPSGTLNHF